MKKGNIITIRQEIQDDPAVCKELAKRLKSLKEIFRFYCEKKKRVFSFDRSVMRMFEFKEIHSN